MPKKDKKSFLNSTSILFIIIIFTIFTSSLSIMYFITHALGFPKELTIFAINPKFLQSIANVVNIKLLILSCWIICLVSLICVCLLRYLSKKLHKEEETIVKILKNNNNPDKLISFVLTDSWGNVLWTSDLFKQIFKIEANNELNLLQVLNSSYYIECNKSNIETIEYHLKHKQSGYVDLPIKVARVDSLFRLSFLLIGNSYIWQIMLIDNKKVDKENEFENIIKNIPSPAAVYSKSGKILGYNSLFKKVFNTSLKGNSSNIFDLLGSKLSSEKQLSKGVFYNKINCKIDNKLEITVIVLSHTVEKEDKSYIKSIFIPLGSEIFDIDIKDNNIDYVEYFDGFYKDAPIGTIILNKEDNILTYNTYIKDLFDRKNISNSNFYNIFPVDISYLKKQFDQSLDEKISFEEEIGNKFYKIFIASLNESNRIVYLQDITEQKKLETSAKHSQGLQTVGQIASVVAHDFNNLLTAIMSFTYFAQEQQDEKDPVYAELEQIKQNANKAKIMIRQLLTFSRKQELKPVSFDINSEISDLMSTILRLMGDKIKPIFKRGKNAGNVIMDKVQLHQVITNLVVNARDAMKTGDTLEIFTSSIHIKTPKTGVLDTIPEGKYVCIEIKDKGTGIKDENLKQIFKPHFSTKGEKGNGLGLDTVYKIITDSAGFIDVKTKIGKGTSFYIYLPRDEEKNITVITEEVFEQQAILDLTGAETVLFVEDEAPVRMVCSRLLKNKGYNVIEAASGNDALKYLEENSVTHLDLVISDVMMPNMNGPELVGRVRDKFPNVKALLISGYTEDVLEDIMSDVSLKGIEFLAKPFTPDVFATRIRNVLSSENKKTIS